MLIGVPKEIKTDEYRVGLVPAIIKPLTAKGHNVVVETGAGKGAGISDEEYVAAGAEISTRADQIFVRCELIVKVKEPLDLERRMAAAWPNHLHLSATWLLILNTARDLMASGVAAIAYETVTDAEGKLPLLRAYVQDCRPHGSASRSPFSSNVRRADAVILLGADQWCRPQARLSFSAAASLVAMPLKSRLAWAPMLRSWCAVPVRRISCRSVSEVAHLFSPLRNQSVTLCVSADVVIGAALVPGAAARQAHIGGDRRNA